MSKICIISKYFVKTAIEENFKSKKFKVSVTAAFMFFMVVLLSMPFGIIVNSLYKPLEVIGQQGMLLSMMFLASSTMIFFFGIFTVMNIFYFSGDIEELLPLPFKSSEIVLGKFLAALITMSIYSGILLIPLVLYGLNSGAGLIYYIYMIISMVLVTIFPMILAATICIVLMQFTSLSKHKDLFKIITGLLSLVIVIGLNLFFQTSGDSANTEYLTKILSEGNNSGMKILSSIFVVNKFILNALIDFDNLRGFTQMICAIIFSISIFTIYYIVAGKIYLRSVIGLSESYSKRKKVLESNIKITRNSQVIALVKKDIKIIFRTPVFFINCIAMLIYMPAIFGIIFLSNGGIQNIRTLIEQSSKYNGIILVIIFVASALCISSGGAATTALSREGKDFLVSKYIPVHYKTQLKAKITSSLLVNIFSSVVIIISLITLKVNGLIFILGSALSISTVIFITLLGMYLDFKNPKLDWDDEKSMFKNNFSSIMILFTMLILGSVFLGLTFIIKSYFVIFTAILSIEIIVAIALYDRMTLLSKKVYNNEEG